MSQRAWDKSQPMVWKHTDSPLRKKSRMQFEVHADIILSYEMIYHYYRSLEKGILSSTHTNFTLFIE